MRDVSNHVSFYLINIAVFMKKNHIVLISIYAALFICYLACRSYLNVNEIDRLNDKIKEYQLVSDFHEDRAFVVKDGKLGFIDKSGDLVIPMKWDYEDVYEIRIGKVKFENGRCFLPRMNNSKEYIIDKSGNELYSGDYISTKKFDDFDIMYVQNDSLNEVYFVYADHIDKIKELENDNPIIAYHYNYKESDKETQVFFSLENLCGGKIVGEKKLEEEYGYKSFRYCNYSFDSRGLLLLQNVKTNKYGIVDKKGNIVVPFDYDNAICFCYGLLIEVICLSHESEIGLQKYPICCNVYKEGRLLYEKLPFYDESRLCDGMFLFFGCKLKDMYERFEFLQEDEYKFPESIEKTIFLDIDGNEVDRFPFGKNYLRISCSEQFHKRWQLEDVNGKLLYPYQFDLYCRYKNSIYAEVYECPEGYKNLRISDTGDTILAAYAQYKDAGLINSNDTLSADVYPLCEYNKELSEKDNYLNCHFSMKRNYVNHHEKFTLSQLGKGRFLPFDVDDVTYFSDGLLRLKLGDRYFFVDENGNGVDKIKIENKE